MPAITLTLSPSTPPLSIEDYRRRARRKVPDMVWAYVESGADDLVTLRANRRVFDDWSFRPRVLTGNEATKLSVTVAEQQLDLPVFLSPTGMTGLVHWTGEAAAARAAEAAGTRAVISTAASYSVEEIAEVTRQSHFFQLYAATNPATGVRAMTESFIQRAEDAGFGALFVTVDVPALGNRESERRYGMGVPPTLNPQRVLNAAIKPSWWINFLRHQRISSRMLVKENGARAGVDSVKAQYRLMRPDLTWDDFSWIRDRWKKPLFIKGVLDPADAAIAVDLGADGVMVSNHGGRQLDGAPSALAALPAVVDAVGDRVPVLLDGGVRRGSDVVKALCLGATAVGIGRPYLYGLGARGEAGVGEVLGVLRAEIVRTMTLLGVADVADLGRHNLVAAAELAAAGRGSTAAPA